MVHGSYTGRGLKHVSYELPASNVLFYQYGLISIIYLGFFVLKISFSKNETILPGNPLAMGLKCIFSSMAYIFYILCGFYSNLIDNALLLNTEAIFLPLILWIFARKKISSVPWIWTIVGFIGIVFILVPTSFNFQVGQLLGVLSGAFYAYGLYMTAVVVKTDSPIKVGVYFSLTSLLICGIWAFNNTLVMPSQVDLINLGIAALLSTGALYLFFESFYYANPHILAVLGYSLVLFSGLIEWINWSELPSSWELIGFLLVFLAGVIIIKKSKMRNV